MQLIYYAHSYRKSDDDVNEFFQDLMVAEALTASLDPPIGSLKRGQTRTPLAQH